MYLKHQIGKNVVAVLFLLAIILPSAIQFSHMMEGHEGIACNDQSNHIHKSEKSCETCAFKLTSLSYAIVKYPDLLSAQISVRVSTSFTPIQFNRSTFTNKQLRAPPVFS